MKYIYYIIYTYDQNNWNRFSCCEFTMKKEIEELKDIEYIVKSLEESLKLTNITVINFKHLRYEH